MDNEQYKKRKSRNIVLISVIVLFTAVIILWFINDNGITREGAGTIIHFTANGEIIYEADMEYIKSFESETINAVIRSSGKKPVEAEYTGVLLTSLLGDMNIDIDGIAQIVVKGMDGYMIAIAIEEIKKDNIYIAYEMNGEPLKPREKNGNGPYQLLMPDDPDSQRWCKYVCEVEVK